MRTEGQNRGGLSLYQRIGKALVWCLLTGIVCWAAGIVLIGMLNSRRGDMPLDPRPVLLAIRDKGELRTVSFEMKDVIRHETSKEPEGWVAAVPGAGDLVRAATHNEALVVANGSVDAGIDLSQLSEQSIVRAQNADGSEVLRVQLPPVMIYPPNVTVNVQDSHSGLFWRDRNLVPKAEAEATRRFREAAENSGIREQARVKAIALLTEMLKQMGHTRVEFVQPEVPSTRSGQAAPSALPSSDASTDSMSTESASGKNSSGASVSSSGTGVQFGG